MPSRVVKSKSRGLGDDIRKFTEATGIDKVVKKVEAVTGVPCGCEERQEYLNQIFPSKEK